ncbi:hypothetical protein BCR42DRAFT_442643 [Absidia repens]|uniref:Uncharacterized protein n=1 Tax=Absidia repens TaxID=90262 RepID=A0A1X2I263_9FUNG|nr:hypothetical protein BCR42DRAFT_442643 [Absidia repens]
MAQTKHDPNCITRPNQAYTRQQAYDSDTNTLHSSECSPTNMSSAATLSSKDEKSLDKKSAATFSSSSASSGWLYKRQKNNQRNRAMLGCIGLIVFMVLLGTVVLWVGSAFILPQNKYSTTLSQVPLSSSYSFNHHRAISSHHTIKSTKTSAPTNATTKKPKATSVKPHHQKYQDDDDYDDDDE